MNSISRIRCGLATVGLILFVFVITGCDSLKWGSIGYNQDYAPEQPIAFSHKLHAGQYQVPCLYCHTSVERSNHATVPSLNVCMNCHLVVATDKPAIQKLSDAYNDGKSMNWVKVHMLPDHVKFNHKRHVKTLAKDPMNRQMACKTCHGEVQTMDRVKQVSNLSMGWCVNCHRKPENKAPLNCSTCHQ